MVYNSERWKSEKERGTASKSYREFTNESGNLWKEMSNHEKSIYDARANHQPFCLERARKRGLTPEQAEREDCAACLERCEKYRAKADKLHKRALAMEQKAEEGPRPLAPFMEYSAKHKGDFTGNPIQRAKQLGAAWRELSDAEKKVYETDAYRAWREKKKTSLGNRLKKTRPSASTENDAEE